MTTVSIDVDGNAFDNEGNRVDLEKYGFAVTTVTTVPESHLNDDGCTLDIHTIANSISVTQRSGLPDIPSDDSILEAAMAEDTQATIATVTQNHMRSIPEASDSVISVPSGESNPKKCKLLSKETESNFLEDHFLDVLDTGNFLNVMYNTRGKLSIDTLLLYIWQFSFRNNVTMQQNFMPIKSKRYKVWWFFFFFILLYIVF